MKKLYPFHLMTKPVGPLCNLDCEYCFYLSKEDMFNQGGKTYSADFVMKDDVLEHYIKGYINAQKEGTAQISFAWQGGEPSLLPISFFQKALNLQKKYARSGMRIVNTFQTNGTLLTKEWAEWFRDNNFLVGISIDGPEDLHDRFRKYSNGKGSFIRVMKGLENLKAAGTEFNTMTVVNSENAKYPEKVYSFLKSTGTDFFQFIPLVETASGLPGESTVSGESPDSELVRYPTVSAVQWGDFLNRTFDKWVKNDIGRIFILNFDAVLSIYAGYPSPVCVHAETCGNAMAIEHDGSIYSCDHYVFPEYYLGNIMEKSMEEIVFGDKQQEFGRSKKTSLPEKCRACRFLNVCRGGCPKNRILPTDSGKLNWLCEGYYSFFDHTEPHFTAMRAALLNYLPASEFRRFFIVDSENRPSVNAPCPCGSGRKFKHCHGNQPLV